jgi:hypothetical protein
MFSMRRAVTLVSLIACHPQMVDDGGNTPSPDTGTFTTPDGSASEASFDDGDDDASASIGDAGVIGHLPKSGARNTGSNLPGEDDGSVGTPWPNPRFTSANGIVHDNLTGLDWTENVALFQGTYAAAQIYVAAMNMGQHPNFGRTDWRIPTWKEMLSLASRGAGNDSPPALPLSNPFINAGVDAGSATYHWTSTTHAQCIFLYYEHTDDNDRCELDNAYNLMAVAGSSPVIISSEPGKDQDVAWNDARFVDNNDGTVSDMLTGLMWTYTQTLGSRLMTWASALNYVAAMNAGQVPSFGHTDWRVPTIVELESMARTGAPFTGSPKADCIWSSTAYGGDDDNWIPIDDPLDGGEGSDGVWGPFAAYCLEVSAGLHSGGNGTENKKQLWAVR